MNIGLLTPYYTDNETTNSGLANHFSILAHALAKNGNRVTVIHVRPKYDHETTFAGVSTDGNITVLTYKISLSKLPGKLLVNRWAVASFLVKVKCMVFVMNNLDSIIKKQQLNVIETTSYFSLCNSYFKFKKQRIPVAVRVSTTFSQIMDEHYPFKSRFFNLLGRMEIAMIRKSKFLITHARNHALELQKLYGINTDSFTIIPHGINMPDVMPPVNNTGIIKILYVGRMEYRKGIDTLLASIPLVLKQNANVFFELIGTDAGNTYQNEFRSNQPVEINQKVKFSGNLNNEATSYAYANCDIFVAPSRYESFGLIYIEAMSYAKPVIGCNVGGVPEIIENGKNGLFAKTGDAHDLAKQLLILINNADERLQMGAYALATVKAKFTADKLAANSVNYYQQIITAFTR